MKEYLLILIILLQGNLFSQFDTLQIDSQELIESLIDESQEDVNDEQLLQIFEDLQNSPVNLNSAALQDLLQIPFLDLSSANYIIEHRNKFGYFFSVNELFAIKNLDNELTKKLLPFFTVSKETVSTNNKQIQQSKSFWNDTFINLRSRFIQDLQPRKGFLNNRYEGSRFKNYNRLQLYYGSHYRIHILTEKDPGENRLTDFYSFNFSAKNLSFFNSIIIGDYLIEFGQGLALWRPYGFSKGGDAILPLMKKDRNIIPYNSADENQFFRGITASFDYKYFQFTSFYSQNYFDASIDSTTNEITSMPLDGFHRTESELLRKNSATKIFYGGRIDYVIPDNLSLGFLLTKSFFNYQIATSGIGNRKGKVFNHYSLSYKYFHSKFTIFGETAFDGISFATINGLIFSAGRDLSFATLFRSYSKGYTGLHSLGFGESSGTKNETGIYSGIRWKTKIGLFNIYFDLFKFPAATFSNPLPTQGKEFLIDHSYKPVRTIETRLRYKNEKKELSALLNSENQILLRDRKQFRFEILYDISKVLRLRNRIEINSFKIDDAEINENGFLFYTDLRYIPNNKFIIQGRIIFFRTDSYNSRIYEYENDLSGIMTNLAMFGEGVRWYLLVKYSYKKTTFGIKYSETFKPKEKTMSSGDNEIMNNIDNRVSIQFDIQF